MGEPEALAADLGSGPVPEVTIESLARWEPPETVFDADGDDVYLPLAQEDGDDLSGELPRGEVANLTQIKLPDTSRPQEFDAGDFTLFRGDEVVVETDRGLAVGTVVAPSVRMFTKNARGRRVLRKVGENDLRQQQRHERKMEEALPFARQRVAARKLPMKLTRVEYLHGGHKAVFYFSAEGRVDFRDLVRDLAHRLHTRIEMRQIGVRDEAKMVGGIGVCGQALCCHRHLTKFEPVSIRMAKDQNLVLNPQKVSGQCGRLKCCLAYEEQLYRERRKGMPKLGKQVVTPDGPGRVTELDILERRVRVQLQSGGASVYAADDVEPARAPAGGRRDAKA